MFSGTRHRQLPIVHACGEEVYVFTTNVSILQAIFNRLDELGQLKEQESQQLYSEAAGKFLADRLVSGTCPKCGYEVELCQSLLDVDLIMGSTPAKSPHHRL